MTIKIKPPALQEHVQTVCLWRGKGETSEYLNPWNLLWSDTALEPGEYEVASQDKFYKGLADQATLSKIKSNPNGEGAIIDGTPHMKGQRGIIARSGIEFECY